MIYDSVQTKYNACVYKMKHLTWTDVAVPVVFMVFVVMRAFDRVINKRIADILQQPAYNNVYSNLVFPIGATISQGVLSVGYVCVQRYYFENQKYDWRFALPNWKHACNTGSYWQVPLVILALLQNIGNLGNSLSAPFLSQNMQSILQNLNIPFCMIGALFFLNTRFFSNHYLACLTIIMAALVSLTVALTPDAKICDYQYTNVTSPIPGDAIFSCQALNSLNMYIDGNGQWQSTTFVWYLIYVLGVAVMAASNVYQQAILQAPDLEIMWSSLWIGIWQIPTGALLLLTLAIPTTSPGVPVSQIGEAISEAMTCFFGSVPVPTTPGITPDMVQICAGNGGLSAFEWFLVYSCFNITFNVLLMWLTKYLSTTWAQIATILCLDIAGLLSMSSALQGGSASFPTVSEWFGYVLAAIGLFVYNLQDEVDRDTGITKCLIRQQDKDTHYGAAESLASMRSNKMMNVEPVTHPEEITSAV